MLVIDVAQTFPLSRSSRTHASVTKSVDEVILPQEVPHVMRRAMHALRNGRLGPVMVEVPDDVRALVAWEDMQQQFAKNAITTGVVAGAAVRQIMVDDYERMGRLVCNSGATAQ